MATINITKHNFDTKMNDLERNPKLPKFKDLMAGINKVEEEAELTFNTYQELAKATAVFPGRGTVGAPMYLALGLCGEAGEVAEKIKKYFRDGIQGDPEEWRDNLIKEMGDVLWYLANLADVFEVNFSDVGVVNLEKLASRQARNKLNGSGDNR